MELSKYIENMQLQKQISRVYKGKEYPKYVIVISPSEIEKLGWEDGDELESEINNHRLSIEPKKK